MHLVILVAFGLLALSSAFMCLMPALALVLGAGVRFYGVIVA